MNEPSKSISDIEAMQDASNRKSAADSPRYASGSLFAASNEIRIDHNGAVYTLRITRSGGLLLNK
jgi:hemin uptake protein HemP